MYVVDGGTLHRIAKVEWEKEKEAFPKLHHYRTILLFSRPIRMAAALVMLIGFSYELLHYLMSYDKSYVWVIIIACDLLWLFLAAYEEILYQRWLKSSECRRYITKYRKPMKK